MNRMLLILAIVIFFGASGRALDLVREGQPASTIVIPEQATALESEAARKLADYLAMSASAKIPIVKENEQSSGPVISIGKTKLAAQAGISDKDLKFDGYILRVKENSLFLLGRDNIPNEKIRLGARGSIRAVLGLLEQLGFRWIQPATNGVYVPPLKNVTVPDALDVTFNPPFMYASSPVAANREDWFMANGFRSSVNIYSEGGHTWHTFVSSNLWETHPEYFQMRDGKRVKPEGDGYFLCPSNPEVQKLLADGIRKKFDAGFDMVQLGQSDGYCPCECEACKALDQPGEIQEQIHVPHYNVIMMVEQTHPDKIVHMLIYPPSNIPSRKIDKYPANVMPEVCLTWTTAQAFVGRDNFTPEKLAKGHQEALKFWADKMPAGLTAYVYYMGTYHAVGLAPKFTPRKAAEAIRMLNKSKVKGIHFCGGLENWGAEGPTYYVIGRMMNDPSQEWSPLVDEYCRYTFGKAATTMRGYYDLLYARIEGAPFAAPNVQTTFKAEYPLPVLEKLDGLLQKAKMEAAGDNRAMNWLRLVEIGHRHLSLLVRAYHYYDVYKDTPSPQDFEKIRQAVLGYRALTDEILNMLKSDPAFLYGYFCSGSWGHWKKDLATNGGMGSGNLVAPPFTWDFDAIAKSGGFPGGVQNPSFESTDLEIRAPRDWSVTTPQGTAAEGNFIDQAVAHSGQKSLHIAFGPDQKGQSFVVYQSIQRKYPEGKSYNFSCWVKTRDLKGSAAIGVLRYPVIPEDARVYASEKTLSGTVDWTQISVTFKVRPGMTETQIRCIADATSGDVWFDDANFEEAAAKPAEAGNYQSRISKVATVGGTMNIGN